MPRPLVEVHQAGECGLRLPREAGGYSLLMVYDWVSLGSLIMSLFEESREELMLSNKTELQVLEDASDVRMFVVTQKSGSSSAFFGGKPG